MAVNRYDQPIDSQFINTYVPIPFEQMLQAGAMKQQRYDQSAAAIDQSIANATVTKITLDTETFDTDNAFASNKFTVPSGAAGKYFFIGTITWVNLTDQDEAQVRIHKNGTFVQGSGYFQGQNGTVTYQATQVLDLSVGDYIELHGYQVSGGNISADGGEAYTNLKGFRLGGV